MRRTLAMLPPLAAVLIAVQAGCFSERSPVGNSDLTGDCRFAVSSAVPGTTVVAIKAQRFAPAEIRIRAGGTVTWINCEAVGAVGHTSTADQGQWSSLTLSSGDLFSHQFAQAGNYSYHCGIHPFMTATVVVE